MNHGDTYKYKVSEIIPKEGKLLQSIHYEVLNRPCRVIELKIGERAFIEYLSPYDEKAHVLRTSIVENYMTHNGEEEATIETQNTIYVISKE